MDSRIIEEHELEENPECGRMDGLRKKSKLYQQKQRVRKEEWNT